jgi:hypothetical protein
MNVKIGAEAMQFPEKEHINGIAVAVQMSFRPVVIAIRVAYDKHRKLMPVKRRKLHCKKLRNFRFFYQTFLILVRTYTDRKEDGKFPPIRWMDQTKCPM